MTAVLSDIFSKFNNKKNYSFCKFICESVYFDYDNSVKLCPYNNLGLINENFDGIWFDTEKFMEERKNCINLMTAKNLPSCCSDCIHLDKTGKIKIKQALKYIYFSDWKFCYVNCSYCKRPKTDDFIKAKHYDILPSIKQMIDKKLLNTKTKFVFECGDACVHPEFDKIIYFLLDYEAKNIIVNTPALRYCQSISDMISKNSGEVIITFDAGTKFTFNKIKGLDRFDEAVNNIKKYVSHQEPDEKRVILKFTMLEGINDNEKEILEWFILSRDLKIKKLLFEIESTWYKKIKNSVPKYIKDIIIFVKNMADYNNISLEFGVMTQAIYNSTSREKE